MLGNTIGEWKSGSQSITLYRAADHFSARIQDQTGSKAEIDSKHIKCGILGTTPHDLMIQKIDRLGKEHFAVCCYPFQGQPTEVWVFEATKGASLWIKKAKENLNQRDPEKEEKTIRCYKESIKNFEEAVRFQKNQKGDATELNSVILQLQKKLLLLQIKRDLPLYLSSAQERETLIKIIEIYSEEEDIFSSLSEYLNLHKELTVSPCQLFLSALMDEHFDHPSLAIQNYLHLAEYHSDPLPCFKKAEELVKQTIVSDPFALPHFLEKLDRNRLIQLRQTTRYPEDLEKFILQKDAVRMTFEKCLATLTQHSPQTKAPTCFICFNDEEADVAKWLEQMLVPDLDQMGIQPLFCFRDVNPGNAELNNFQGLIRRADQVVIACTPDLKRKCEERKTAPTGVAQEIRLAKERYNDSDKYETIFLLYLKGERKESCPSEFFEPIQGIKLNKSQESSVFSYYENAFEFFGGMRNIPRNISRQIKDDFLLKANKIFAGEINREDLEKWRQTRQSQIESILKAAQERVTKMIQMVHLPLPPKNFTGRHQELQDLHTACQHHHRVAITGLGGIGKTALALKYANDYQAHYQFIYHTPAGTSQLIRDGLLQLADDLHIPKIGKIEERLQSLKGRLDQFEQKYLLIFDGIDQVEAFDEFTKYLPDRGNCLLLTSRMPERSRKRDFELIDLKPFSLEDAANYLLQATGSEEKEKANELAELLGRLPLALTHAAGYIRSRNISIHEYIYQFNQYQLKLFEDERLDLLTKEEKTILTTWNISLHAIETVHRCSLAKEMIAFFAFLGQAPIPLDLVKNWFKTTHSKEEELDCLDALRHLCGYSMIDSLSPDFYQIHPLVQQVIQYRMANPQKVFEHAFTTLYLQMKKSKREEGNTWNLTKSIIPHALPVLKRQDLIAGIALKNQHKFMILLGGICKTHGNFHQALEIEQSSLKVAKQWHGSYPQLKEAHDALGTSYHNTGGSLEKLGKYDKSLKYHNKALEIWLKSYSEEHPNVALSYNNIGLLLNNSGKYGEALEYHQKALKIRLKIYGENHLEMANSYNNIGLSLLELKKYDDALEYQQKALKIRLEKYGETHRDVAVSYNNIGGIFWELKKFDEALTYHKKALEIRLKVCGGEDHPDLASSYDNIGLNLESLGKYQEALEHQQKAREIRLKVYGEIHPCVATSYNNIGSSLRGLGKLNEALNFDQKALKIRQEVYGEEHPIVASSYDNIGASLKGLKKFDDAFGYFLKALRIRLKACGEEHLDMAESYNNIGVSLSDLGRYEEALKYYRKALEIRQKMFGEVHSDVAAGYNNVGMSLNHMCKYKEAFLQHKKALEIGLKVHGEHHPLVAIIYINLWNVLNNLKDYEEAFKYNQKALEILLKLHGEEHPMVALCYSNFGISLEHLEKYREALSYYEKTLKIQLKVYGEDHPDVAISYNSIGTNLHGLRKHDEALRYFQKASEILLKVYGEKHPDVATSYNNIGGCLKILGKFDEASKFYQKALQIFGGFYPPDHLKLKEIRQLLNTTLNNASRRQETERL